MHSILIHIPLFSLIRIHKVIYISIIYITIKLVINNIHFRIHADNKHYNEYLFRIQNIQHFYG